MNLEQKIEAILFYRNEPLEIKKLAKILKEEEGSVMVALDNLSKSLESRGITLINTGVETSLATGREVKELIEEMAKDEMKSEIGKSGLETLAIILYNGPISRREIDFVRGVNSTFTLRNLAMRGLIERESGEKGAFKYRASIALLAHLGLNKIEDLPEFKEFKQKLTETSAQANTEEKNGE